MAETRRVLVVDDDPAQRRFLRAVLESDGWAVTEAETGDAALAQLTDRSGPDVVLSDLMMPGMDGRQLLGRVQSEWPEVPVIILTAHGSVDSAVALLHEGAYDYLTKPPKIDELRITVRRAVEETTARRELARLRRRLRLPADVVAVSQRMQEVLETALRVAGSATPVLISGEEGTGKEVVARAIHAASGRGAFATLNSAALPPEQVGAELFGTGQGTSVGAERGRTGLIETAEGGTLFVEELADLPVSVQPPLLRFLETGVFRRLGEDTDRASSARVIGASCGDPREHVASGRLRADLADRLGVVRIDLPALRDRAVDIPALAEHLLRRLAERYQLERAELSPDALAALTGYRWPGNIRELENVLTRALALRKAATINAGDLPQQIGGPAPSVPASGDVDDNPTLPLEEVERRYIFRVLEATRGNKLKAAAILGIDRSTLHRKLKQLQGFGDRPTGP